MADSSSGRQVAHQWSIVIPVLNDAQPLGLLLRQLAGHGFEIIVSDGGSSDNTFALAKEGGAIVTQGAPGRGAQLVRGIALATRPWLWILHADSTLRLPSLLQQLSGLCDSGKPAWGRFDVALVPNNRRLATIAWFMNWRSRLTRICTGDQGMFVHRQVLAAAGGMPPLPLMEDIELSRALKRTPAPFVALAGKLGTSSRRWQRQGTLRTLLLMWWCRLRYWLGTPAIVLAAKYYRANDV